MTTLEKSEGLEIQMCEFNSRFVAIPGELWQCHACTVTIIYFETLFIYFLIHTVFRTYYFLQGLSFTLSKQ